MIENLEFYRITELPSGNFDNNRIFSLIGNRSFLVVYDFASNATLIGFESTFSEELKTKIEKGIPGFGLIRCSFPEFEDKLIGYSVYKHIEKENFSRYDIKPSDLFEDLFDSMPKEGFIVIAFILASAIDIDSSKSYLERILSSKSVRETESSLGQSFVNKSSSSIQRDVYYKSEETIMFNRILESINKSVLGNGAAYKVFLISKRKDIHATNYVIDHFLILEEYELNNKEIGPALEFLSKRNSLPFGVDYAKEFLKFYGFYKISHNIFTQLPLIKPGISIGKFMKEGVLDIEIEVNLEPSTLNLGFIITGLPGSGKTREAMSIINSVISSSKSRPMIFIITPTEEWKVFALEHDMYLIGTSVDNVPINFFRCPPFIEIEKFYGNLAMILSSAANAGPYQNPMEKCILNAFKHIYENERNPDPILVYDEIERSIIKYHGKKTNVGVKYTKHGENIKSALENLRGILNKPQYAVQNGIKIEDLAENGVVFDVSKASINTKVHLYALILNQIYALTSKFDSKGDNELRLIICIEEAQTIFGSIESPAVQDIKQRIQDFRKQGIGLILLTHNVSDIEVGIRRLCQLKLYLKQAPDTAVLASKDLIFSDAQQDNVVLKLKVLGSGIGAFSYIIKNDKEKEQQETIFIKINSYDIDRADQNNLRNPINEYVNRVGISPVKKIDCKLTIRSRDKDFRVSDDIYQIKINYLGEEIGTFVLNKSENLNLRLFSEKNYTVNLLSKKKLVKEFTIKATNEIFLDIGNI